MNSRRKFITHLLGGAAASLLPKPPQLFSGLWKLRDFRQIEPNASLQYDLCIIGAGAAGISIAKQFAGSKLRVCLLESGGLTADARTQALYRAENVGLARTPHTASRLRYFGGSTNHWTGIVAPLRPEDFKQRDWVADSGWPIAYSELEQYYDRALETCQLPKITFDERLWPELGKTPPALNKEKFREFIMLHGPPLRFGPAYQEPLEAADNIEVLLNANLTNIQCDEAAKQIVHLDVESLERRRGKIKAARYVLCCGGIENARLLLLSNSVEKNGLGNQHDLVGRYFLDHCFMRCAEVFQPQGQNLEHVYSDFSHKGQEYRPGLVLSESYQRQHQLLGCGIFFWVMEDPRSRGGSAALRLLSSLKEGEIPDNYGAELERAWDDLGATAGDLTDHLLGTEPQELASPRLEAICALEQAPNRDSRISLSDSTDELGLRRAKVDWRVGEQERQTLLTNMRLLQMEFGQRGLGQVDISDWLVDGQANWRAELKDYNHHMGTTRMSEDPKRGVVDKNCKIHGLANAYIAGSSVFPASGFMNPTLTIVALALRLADHLKGN